MLLPLANTVSSCCQIVVIAVWCHIFCSGGPLVTLAAQAMVHFNVLSENSTFSLGARRHILLSLAVNPSAGVQILIVLHYIQFGGRENSMLGSGFAVHKHI